MSRLVTFLAMTAVVLGVATPATATAPPLTLSTREIVSLPPSEGGLDVTMEGEAILAALRSDDGHVFVNLLQDDTAVGVWMPREQADRIDGFGRYGRSGTFLRVEGVVNVACAQHGGDLDVHAARVEVVSPSREAGLVLVPPSRIALAVGVVAAAGIEWGLYRRLRRRSRAKP